MLYVQTEEWRIRYFRKFVKYPIQFYDPLLDFIVARVIVYKKKKKKKNRTFIEITTWQIKSFKNWKRTKIAEINIYPLYQFVDSNFVKTRCE